MELKKAQMASRTAVVALTWARLITLHCPQTLLHGALWWDLSWRTHAVVTFAVVASAAMAVRSALEGLRLCRQSLSFKQSAIGDDFVQKQTLECGDGESLVVPGGADAVLRAWYGKPGYQFTNRSGFDVTRELKQYLAYKQEVQDPAELLQMKGVADPAAGVLKKLFIDVKVTVEIAIMEPGDWTQRELTRAFRESQVRWPPPAQGPRQSVTGAVVEAAAFGGNVEQAFALDSRRRTEVPLDRPPWDTDLRGLDFPLMFMVILKARTDADSQAGLFGDCVLL